MTTTLQTQANFSYVPTHNSTNSSTNSLEFYGLDAEKLQIVLLSLCGLASLTTLGNIVVLLASKFTTAGRSATLVFIRSLCIADMLIGTFGVFKSLLLRNIKTVIINCFLPEGLFISASTTLALSLLWLNVDSYLRLTRPLGYSRSMDKTNVITAMVVVWNMSFIVGFLPQMGWNSDEFACYFFHYYSSSYFLFVGAVWTFCLVGSCIFQYALMKTTNNIRQNSNFISPHSTEFKKYCQLIVTLRIDITIWLLTYTPLIIYIALHCGACLLAESDLADTNLAIFIPIFLLRSFISAFVHSYRTVQIQQVMRTMPKRMSRVIRKTISQTSSLTDDKGSPVETVSGGVPSQQTLRTLPQPKSKLPLCTTASNLTLLTSIDEVSITEEITRL